MSGIRRSRELVIHDLFQYKTSGITCLRQRDSQAVYLNSVVSFCGKLYMLNIYVNSEARWTKFLIENEEKK